MGTRLISGFTIPPQTPHCKGGGKIKNNDYIPTNCSIFHIFLCHRRGIFLGALANPQDFDLGWHLKYGEYAVQNKTLLWENTFSSAMPEYRYINHAWGTDIITYVIFNNFGFLGLSVAGAFIIAAAWFVFARAARFDFWQLSLTAPLTLYFFSSLLGESFRGQFLSLFFLGVLWFLLRRFEEGKQRSLYFVPLLFLVWANFHGQFLMGLILFSIWIVGLCYSSSLSAANNKAKQEFFTNLAGAWPNHSDDLGGKDL